MTQTKNHQLIYFTFILVTVVLCLGFYEIAAANTTIEHSRATITRTSEPLPERGDRSRDTATRGGSPSPAPTDESGTELTVEQKNANGELTIIFRENGDNSNADIKVTINGSVVTDNGEQRSSGGAPGQDGADGTAGTDTDSDDEAEATDDSVEKDEDTTQAVDRTARPDRERPSRR